jgi:hemoglobin-like flavoprotein
MTPQQVTLVQQTFEQVAPIAPTAASLFYNRLFTLDPSLRPLFRGNMETQGKKLMASLALVARGLDNPEQILAAIRHLGQRHVRYGVQAEDYETVGQALLWTLAQGLGDAFTAEVAAAWEAAYSLLSDLMQEAAQELELAVGL